MKKEKDTYYTQVEEAAAWLKNRVDIRPKIGLLTGTGLGEAVNGMDRQATIDYQDIPHFPLSTVQSHPGRLLLGTVSGMPMVAMQGRVHLYEGYSALDVTFPVRVMQTLGIEYLILTNAAGGLNPDLQAGDIMLITDHINLAGTNPLVGPNEDRWGDRFPDMGFAYDMDLARHTKSAAAELKIRLRSGIYAGLTGPSLETPAEIRYLRTIGTDAVGLSTVQEVIAAVHGGMKVLGISTIANVHTPDNPIPTNVDEIIAVAETAAASVNKLIHAVVNKI